MRPVLVLNVVGLTPAMLGENTPNLKALANAGATRPLETVTPAVTCSVQSTLLTGTMPSQHGIVGNGWYFRELAEIWLWRQSNHLVNGEMIWDAARKRDPEFSVAKLFWWYNMYSSADVSVTPRPQYPADGRKFPDVYTQPPELRDQLQTKLGQFPLFRFWGPAADVVSTEWIGRSAELILQERKPTLTLVYLPHLDYDLQRLGPDDPAIATRLREVDVVAGRLIDSAHKLGASVIALSEYGITRARGAILINRVLREAGLLTVRREDAGEQLDPGASQAFAVVDHQIAHVYVREPSRIDEVRTLCSMVDGVEAVWGQDEKRAAGLDHARSGELVLIAKPERWFQYYFWLDDAHAPDYARTVDIHRKPGYDPVELFLDPEKPMVKARIGLTLLARKLGMRAMMDVIPLDPSLVKGTHGRVTDRPEDGPVFITDAPEWLDDQKTVRAVDVKSIVLRHVFGGDGDRRTV